MNRPCSCGRFFSFFRGRMTGDKSLKYMLLTLALTLTCTLVGSLPLSGADGGGRKARGRVLRVALVGDPQVDDSTEMGYARRSVYRELYGRRDLDMCIFLGDMVNDNMSLLPESVGVVDSLPYQCFMVPGNHDRDVYRGPKSSTYRRRDLSTWRKVVGYVDTSFVRGNVRFIMMNNVRHASAGMTDYEGGFTEKQKHWLDSVLVSGVARSGKTSRGSVTPALTILATHIPFSQMKGRDSVLARIPEQVRMLYVSGHTHFVSRDDSIPEVIAGATCGSWWRGVKDSDGVPYALQSCGAPRGYFVAEIRRDGDYTLRYRCVGRDDEVSVWGVRVYDGGAVRAKGGVVEGDGGVYRLYVNVFGGAPDGVVNVRGARRWRIVSCSNETDMHDGSDSPDAFMGSPRKKRHLICERSAKTAPEVEQVIEFNASMSRDYRKSHRNEFIPLRRKPSTHLWQTTCLISSPLPVYVNVVYRDSHMRFRQRVPVMRDYPSKPKPGMD